MANFISYKIHDVETALRNLSKEGRHEQFKHLRYFSNIGPEHVQGYAQYQDGDKLYYAFSHNTVGDTGYILVTNSLDEESPRHIELARTWNHPGGIQFAGQYLFVPCEKGEEAKVFVIDIQTGIVVKTIDLNHRAGCIGITDYNDTNGKQMYLIVVGDKETYHVYNAEVPNDMSKLSLNPMSFFTLKDITFKEITDKGSYKDRKKSIDCQGFGLVTDDENNVCMVATVKQVSEDWVYLLKLGINSGFVTPTPSYCRHIKSQGGVHGDAGIHFRWGAGLRITPKNELAILATARNIISGGCTRLDTNYWI